MDINPIYSLDLKAFMRWMYERLETEYEYQMSLDAFKETALDNDYHFDIDGNLKG
jgi:hypothetical protein